MSVLIESEIPCTYCQFPNAVEIWSIVNVKEDPELRDLLLGGELNMTDCTSCHKVFFAESFLLYHDPAAELLAFVYPHAARDERARHEEKTRTDFETLKASSENAAAFNYAPMSFFGLDELVRLLEEEDERNIQAEIVATLAPELKMPVALLRSSLARDQKVPRVVPGFAQSDRFDRSQLLSALERVEGANPLLSVYSDWRKAILGNPSYEVRLG
jgi:hypothetical protein